MTRREDRFDAMIPREKSKEGQKKQTFKVTLIENNLEHRILFRRSFPSPIPAIFFDRDGVLINDCHYIRNSDQVRLCPGAAELILEVRKRGWAVVVITNQSGISRNLITWQDYENVTSQMLSLLSSNNIISAIYANGYGPDADESTWRKPSPSMIYIAAQDLNLDLQQSILIGDRLIDLQAGAKANMKHLIHVKTGHGLKERKTVESWSNCIKPILIDNLLQFPVELLT